MKKYFLIVPVIAFLFSCVEERKRVTVQLSIVPEKHLQGEVICKGGNRLNYYDLTLTDDYMAFLDYDSDTVLQIYPKDNLYTCAQSVIREVVNKEQYTPPFFINYNYTDKDYPNAITIHDSDRQQVTQFLIPSNGQNDTIQSQTVHLSDQRTEYQELIFTHDLSITKEEVYAAPFYGRNGFLFYFFSSDSGFYWVDAYPPLTDKKLSMHTDILYFPILQVNEQKGSVVAGLRYINSLQFYDMRGNLTKDIILGDHYVFPQPDGMKLHNWQNSIKYITAIAKGKKYVYCLYNGSADFSNPSTIIVFNWKGKHITTLKMDKGFRKIAVDATEKYLYGIVLNEEGGTDVLRYTL